MGGAFDFVVLVAKDFGHGASGIALDVLRLLGQCLAQRALSFVFRDFLFSGVLLVSPESEGPKSLGLHKPS